MFVSLLFHWMCLCAKLKWILKSIKNQRKCQKNRSLQTTQFTARQGGHSSRSHLQPGVAPNSTSSSSPASLRLSNTTKNLGDSGSGYYFDVTEHREGSTLVLWQIKDLFWPQSSFSTCPSEPRYFRSSRSRI